MAIIFAGFFLLLLLCCAVPPGCHAVAFNSQADADRRRWALLGQERDEIEWEEIERKIVVANERREVMGDEDELKCRIAGAWKFSHLPSLIRLCYLGLMIFVMGVVVTIFTHKLPTTFSINRQRARICIEIRTQSHTRTHSHVVHKPKSCV